MIIENTEYGIVFKAGSQIDEPVAESDNKLDAQSNAQATASPAGIVVEVVTQNHPLFFGADDIREKDVRIKQLTVNRNGIIITKENGDELMAPVHINDKPEAKIYEFGKSNHYWIWAEFEGYTFLKEYQVIKYNDEDCLLLKKLLMFRDHRHTITICD